MELNTYNIDKESYTNLLKSLKEDIKKHVELQREYKRHRKTEHFSGERMKVVLDRNIWEAHYYSKDEEYELCSDLATGLHKSHRWDLRLMYATYGVLRGKKLMQIENTVSKIVYGEDFILTEENHPLNVYQDSMQKLVDKYINVQKDGSTGE